MPSSVPLPVERPLAGQQVALVGKLSLLSKRDTRSIVERLGGTFSPDITPRTTVVVTAGDMLQLPPHVQRVLSEDELCREAGLPDLGDAARALLLGARSARHVSR